MFVQARSEIFYLLSIKAAQNSSLPSYERSDSTKKKLSFKYMLYPSIVYFIIKYHNIELPLIQEPGGGISSQD